MSDCRPLAPEPTKHAAVQDLHEMMFARLFGGGAWLADREACDALSRKLDELGLQERVPGDISSTRFTALGKELQLDLVMVFIGLWDELEMPTILEDHGLIDGLDVSRIYDLLETCSDPEHVMRPFVQKAYLKHYNPSGLPV